MDKQSVLVILILILLPISSVLCYKMGYNQKELEVTRNYQKVLKSGKVYYEDEDIEIIVFGKNI